MYAVLVEESLTRLSLNTRSTMDAKNSHAQNRILIIVSLLSDLCACINFVNGVADEAIAHQ